MSDLPALLGETWIKKSSGCYVRVDGFVALQLCILAGFHMNTKTGKAESKWAPSSENGPWWVVYVDGRMRAKFRDLEEAAEAGRTYTAEDAP